MSKKKQQTKIPPGFIGLDHAALHAPIIKPDKEKEQEEERQRIADKIRKAFYKWIENPPDFSDYAMYEFGGPQILVRIFKYFPEEKERDVTLTDLDGAPLVKREESAVIPYGIVIKAGSESRYKAGEVVVFEDKLNGSSDNPAWIDWKAGQKQRPIPETSSAKYEPPRYIENIYFLWRDHRFIGDKFKIKLSREDAYTYLVPDAFVRARFQKPGDWKTQPANLEENVSIA